MYIVKSLNRINRIGAFLLMASVIVSVCAQPLSAQQNSNSTKKVIVGSWVETVTFDGEFMPPLKSLVVFSADGTLTASDQGGVNIAAEQVFSVGTGAWAAQGDRTFNWTTLNLISDLDGNLIGTLKVRGTYTVSESGNAYSGVFYAEVRDASNTLKFSIGGTNAAVRIQVEPMP